MKTKPIIVHIVGNRPQFIKLAPVFTKFKEDIVSTNFIIHTGQHYDNNLSKVFFEDLNIQKPDYYLGVSGGSHAEMTSRLLVEIERTLFDINPDIVVVYGDTNTTLAATLVARKMRLFTVHVEAGVRTGNPDNPEEINRKVIDHICNRLFAPDIFSYNNLIKENLSDLSVFSGDVMYDLFLATKKSEDYAKDLPANDYVLMTWHREENTSDKNHMVYIIDTLKNIKEKIIIPLHPRTRLKLIEFRIYELLNNLKNVIIINPVGYFEMMTLLKESKWVLTDSGGLSKECYFARKICIYFSDLHPWNELEKNGWIIHLNEIGEKKLLDVENYICKCTETNCFGIGNASDIITSDIKKILKNGENV